MTKSGETTRQRRQRHDGPANRSPDGSGNAKRRANAAEDGRLQSPSRFPPRGARCWTRQLCARAVPRSRPLTGDRGHRDRAGARRARSRRCRPTHRPGLAAGARAARTLADRDRREARDSDAAAERRARGTPAGDENDGGARRPDGVGRPRGRAHAHRGRGRDRDGSTGRRGARGRRRRERGRRVDRGDRPPPRHGRSRVASGRRHGR